MEAEILNIRFVIKMPRAVQLDLKAVASRGKELGSLWVIIDLGFTALLLEEEDYNCKDNTSKSDLTIKSIMVLKLSLCLALTYDLSSFQHLRY